MMTETSKCRLMDLDIEEQVRGCVENTEGTMRKDSLRSDSGPKTLVQAFVLLVVTLWYEAKI